MLEINVKTMAHANDDENIFYYRGATSYDAVAKQLLQDDSDVDEQELAVRFTWPEFSPLIACRRCEQNAFRLRRKREGLQNPGPAGQRKKRRYSLLISLLS